MKPSYLIFAVVFLFISISSSGQTDDGTKQNHRPLVNKGYYSIGDNYKKLPVSRQPSVDSLVTPGITKGYHAIKSDNKRLVWFFKQGPRPKVTKGYYSIDSNRQKTDSFQ